MSTFVHTSVILKVDTPLEVRSQDVIDGRILSFAIGESCRGEITMQGDPEVLLAFADKLRDALIAEVGRRWPVEQAHEAVTVDA